MASISSLRLTPMRFTPRNIAFLWLLLLLSPIGVYSQGLRRPNPVRLRVIVSYQDSHAKVYFATVEVMDAVGGSSAMDKKETDQDGRVEFVTTTGVHRIRVSGTDILTYEGTFEITPAESYHFENISVRAKPGRENRQSAGAGATVPVARLQVPESARKQFEKGAKALQKQDWTGARKYFQAAVDDYPKYDVAYNGLGSACWQLNDAMAARAAFLKATELNDRFPEAQRNLARVFLGEHDYEQAASLLEKSLETEPDNVWALENAAYVELQQHRFNEALAHALQVHKLQHKGFANAHVIAGYALEALGRNPEAAEQWRLYLKEDPGGPNAKRAQAAVSRLTSSQPH